MLGVRNEDYDKSECDPEETDFFVQLHLTIILASTYCLLATLIFNPTIILILIPFYAAGLITYLVLAIYLFRKQFRCGQFNSPKEISIVLYIFTFECTFCFVFIAFLISNANEHSLRSLISSFLPIHISVFSIIIAVTILTLTQTVGKYSPRIIELFKTSPDILSIYFAFSIAIFCDIILSNPINYNSWIYWIEFGVAIEFFAVFIIIPYFFIMFVYIRPENLIRILSSKIKGRDSVADSDLILAILDIIYSSIEDEHYTVVDSGFYALEHLDKYAITIEQNYSKQIVERLSNIEIKICNARRKRTLDLIITLQEMTEMPRQFLD